MLMRKNIGKLLKKCTLPKNVDEKMLVTFPKNVDEKKGWQTSEKC
jgi:hypothetical protein